MNTVNRETFLKLSPMLQLGVIVYGMSSETATDQYIQDAIVNKYYGQRIQNFVPQLMGDARACLADYGITDPDVLGSIQGAINKAVSHVISLDIAFLKEQTGFPTLASDGYHDFQDLYRHRNALYVALCRNVGHLDAEKFDEKSVWVSRKYSSGQAVEGGWFLLGINKEPGEQITYHIPTEYWAECISNFIPELPQAPEWDGHTSADVLERLNKHV